MLRARASWAEMARMSQCPEARAHHERSQPDTGKSGRSNGPDRLAPDIRQTHIGVGAAAAAHVEQGEHHAAAGRAAMRWTAQELH
jgi:hypothetical protein